MNLKIKTKDFFPESLGQKCEYTLYTEKYGNTILENSGEIGESGVHFPLHTGGTPSQSSEEESEWPTVSHHI